MEETKEVRTDDSDQGRRSLEKDDVMLRVQRRIWEKREGERQVTSDKRCK